ncbi:hypothetical protein KP509_28G004200 [Ceratopteris richardii]|uniref:Lipid desaturase domain-containing protein n=1 Tax=Ceratopteris richardii TaxID=49495 RepID=A0A8T2RAM9_CERRI|nr:hypothetical protein KP509_28G004200 [Ceratopteris richardii]
MEFMAHRQLFTNAITSSSFSASSLTHCGNNGSTSLLFSTHGKLRCGTPTPSISQVFVVRGVLSERPTVAEFDAAESIHHGVDSVGTLPVSSPSTAERLAGAYVRSLQLNAKQAVDDMGVTDTDLESTWEHRAWLATGNLAMIGLMAKAVEASTTIADWGGMGAVSVAAYVIADLASGIYHWGIDNYGDASTPVFGSQIDAFQGHHKRPWTITKRQFSNNIHALARPAAFTIAPFLLLPGNAALDSFVAVFLACVVYSQQFHAWAHSKKKDVPEIVTKLQNAGLLVSRKMHGAHHRPPYNANYCIVSGLWNPLLDGNRVFSRLEKMIFSVWSVRPRSWTETSREWLQDGSYFSDGTDVDESSAER